MRFARAGAPGSETPLVAGPDGLWRDLSSLTPDITGDFLAGVWYLSQFMVLRPGDVINTGTPAGVALGQPDKPYLRAGDVVQLEIDGLGSQRQVFGQAA